VLDPGTSPGWDKEEGLLDPFVRLRRTQDDRGTLDPKSCLGWREGDDNELEPPHPEVLRRPVDRGKGRTPPG